ncbi:acetyltransferase, GNAT family [Aquipluma nitroreducens]|uniref:Acetyltransferase, GNAT family n=1 Tax=Aquipluma nitroreducens TaxID=2010828 RepID=A0A5K7SEV4_9BACT|nr:GNAT family N-acetyltransferase [Aquipluma nitroreducens]BBE20025.1 acetyltransferase, GNAT family [Aquipluma nitroreducens]
MDVEIRKSTENDFEKVYPLFEQLWPNKELDKKELKVVFDRGVNSDTDELFCLAYSGEVIGFCAYAIVNNLWQAGYISYMYAMVVDENYRGKGFGTMLINEAIQDSKNKGLKRLELDSAFHREKAHEFYLKLGFEKRAFLFSYIL